MSQEKSQGTDLTDDMVELFGENQKVLGELVTKINNVSKNTLMPEKKEKIASFRGQMLAMDLENQASRIQLMTEFLKSLE